MYTVISPRYWRSNQQPQYAEPKPYHWAAGQHRTQAMQNSIFSGVYPADET